MQCNKSGFKSLIRPVVVAISAGLLLPWGCGKNRRGPPFGPPPTPEVAVVTVKTQPVVLTAELPGRVAAYRVAEIRPQVNGLIQKRLFTEGADVKAGDVLYQIEPALFKAAYDSAEAGVEAAKKAADRARAALAAGRAGVARQQTVVALAKINSRRFEDMCRNNAVGVIERDKAVTEAKVAEATLRVAEAQVESNRAAVAEAEARLKQAEAVLATARLNLGYTKIIAPISGRIGRANVTEGALTTAYQPVPLAVIQQINPVYVDASQSSTELLRLQKRAAEGHLGPAGSRKKVKLILGDGTPYPLEGMLQFSDVTVDPTTGSCLLRIVVPNPKGVLLPGMFVQAVIVEGLNKNAVLIPQQAVSRNPKGEPFVLVVDAEGKVAQRRISLDRAIGDKWLVSSGLAPGDRVIVEGAMRVRPGATVKTVSFEDGRKPGAKPADMTAPTAKSN